MAVAEAGLSLSFAQQRQLVAAEVAAGGRVGEKVAGGVGVPALQGTVNDRVENWSQLLGGVCEVEEAQAELDVERQVYGVVWRKEIIDRAPVVVRGLATCEVPVEEAEAGGDGLLPGLDDRCGGE